MSRTFKFAIAAFVIASTFAPAALAEVSVERTAGVEKVSVAVSYDDLDMASPAGGRRLLKRIKTAARDVCSHATLRLVPSPRAVGICSGETIEETVRRANIGTLNIAWSGLNPSNRLASR